MPKITFNFIKLVNLLFIAIIFIAILTYLFRLEKIFPIVISPLGIVTLIILAIIFNILYFILYKILTYIKTSQTKK